jgi:hypothetical protein
MDVCTFLLDALAAQQVFAITVRASISHYANVRLLRALAVYA